MYRGDPPSSYRLSFGWYDVGRRGACDRREDIRQPYVVRCPGYGTGFDGRDGTSCERRRAVEDVLDELDIKADTDSLETKWVVASAEQEENKVKLSDLTIREGLVPRVVGMGAKDAVFLLEQAGLRVSLSGVGRVVSQSIQPGQRVSKGQTVLLTLK